MDEDARIRAVLEHIGCGRDVAEFPATRNEKRALVATAARRRLIAWTRGRHELTARGRRALRRQTALRSGRISARALAVAAGAVALGLLFSADASRLLIGTPTAAVQSRPAMPAPPEGAVAAAAALPEPAPSEEAGLPDEGKAEQPSLPARAAVEAPKPPTPAAARASSNKPKPATKPKRKVAKSHRKGTYASRHRLLDPALAYTDPRQTPLPGSFRFGGPSPYGSQGNWSFFR